MKKSVLFTLPLVLLTIIFACSGDKSDYDKAIRENSIQACENFLQNHPDSKYNSVMEERLAELHFIDAESTNTVAGYREFLAKYPDSKLKAKANNCLDSLLFAEALEYNNADSLESFMDRYPQNNFLEQARQKHEEILFHTAIKYKSSRRLEKYIRQYPKGRFIEEAEAQLPKLKIAHALSVAGKLSGDVMVASGRFLDANRAPLKNREVHILFHANDGREYALAGFRTEEENAYNMRPQTTDEQGVFVLIFDAKTKFGLGLGKTSNSVMGRPDIYRLFYLPTVNSNSKHIDFGDLIVNFHENKIIPGDIRIDGTSVQMNKKEYTLQ